VLPLTWIKCRSHFHAFISQLIDIGVVSPRASINEVNGELGQQLRQFEEYLGGLDLSISSSSLYRNRGDDFFLPF
jgi:hypothetical protein